MYYQSQKDNEPQATVIHPLNLSTSTIPAALSQSRNEKPVKSEYLHYSCKVNYCCKFVSGTTNWTFSQVMTFYATQKFSDNVCPCPGFVSWMVAAGHWLRHSHTNTQILTLRAIYFHQCLSDQLCRTRLGRVCPQLHQYHRSYHCASDLPTINIHTIYPEQWAFFGLFFFHWPLIGCNYSSTKQMSVLRLPWRLDQGTQQCESFAGLHLYW